MSLVTFEIKEDEYLILDQKPEVLSFYPENNNQAMAVSAVKWAVKIGNLPEELQEAIKQKTP